MTFDQFLFIVISVVTLGAALLVVTSRNLFHAALALMLSFLGVAAIYVTLNAGFLAMAQLLIYIGAISILIIFAIMMTRRMMTSHESPFNSQVGLGLLTAVITFAVISYVLINYWPTAPADAQLATMTVVDDAVLRGSVETLGRSFVSPTAYVLPFEVASVLLLAALVGSVFIAWPRTKEEEE